MSFRFLFLTSIILLLISGVAGWLVSGDRELSPEEQRLLAYKAELAVAKVAAETGDAEDWTAYAVLLADASAGAADYGAAMTWFKRAAAEGFAPAQVGVGKLYENGYGVSQDYHRAVDWFRTATRLSDDPEAYFKVGEAYFRGRGVPQDHGSALRYYLRAANQGHAVAQFIVGSMYEAGWGVEKDQITAWVWYRRAMAYSDAVAAHQEDYDVRSAIAKLERGMNNSQRTAAERQFRAIQDTRTPDRS